MNSTAVIPRDLKCCNSKINITNFDVAYINDRLKTNSCISASQMSWNSLVIHCETSDMCLIDDSLVPGNIQASVI